MLNFKVLTAQSVATILINLSSTIRCHINLKIKSRNQAEDGSNFMCTEVMFTFSDKQTTRKPSPTPSLGELLVFDTN